jgi:hypothetical protein
MDQHRLPRHMNWRLRPGLLAAAAACALVACGGGNPLDNPPSVANPAATGGQRLSFLYFQRCIQPMLDAALRVNIAGSISVNTCASGGCHDNRTGTGGALRLVGNPAPVPAGASPEALRDTDLYRNFFSSQGETIVGQPGASRLLNKPLLRGVLHGGGLIFDSEDDDNARLLRYWISRPVPQGQDEFSRAAAAMFTPPDPETGACNLL